MSFMKKIVLSLVVVAVVVAVMLGITTAMHVHFTNKHGRIIGIQSAECEDGFCVIETMEDLAAHRCEGELLVVIAD